MHERRSKGCEVPFKSPERTTCVLQPRGVCLTMTTSLCTSSHTIQSTQATHELALWRSTALPGWVITPLGPGQHPQYTLPSMNGRLWVAQHQPLAQHKMSRAKNSGKHGGGALAGLLCYGPVC